jgi:uncharacterized membrane protein YgaE (UPF0421/DUF939 family)
MKRYPCIGVISAFIVNMLMFKRNLWELGK